ncbi:hypothetical protein B0A49_09701 [Cryomyces minteri]|uniref:Uncharacterized protein n=1 Tax=Cryomyces minteri TaxID=331657 RepID=A0A4U0X6M6_9PEZI|nr:hypothetical protein B0A49_09701 [Cryomyces minteri]
MFVINELRKIPAFLREYFSEATFAALAAYPSEWPKIKMIPWATSLTGQLPNSTSPDSPNTNHPNFLLTETDQQVAIAGFKRLRQLAAAMGVTVGEEVFPDLAVQTDAQIWEVLGKPSDRLIMPLLHGRTL